MVIGAWSLVMRTARSPKSARWFPVGAGLDVPATALAATTPGVMALMQNIGVSAATRKACVLAWVGSRWELSAQEIVDVGCVKRAEAAHARRSEFT